MTDAELVEALEQLAVYYRAYGCACCFPRAREVLARDTHTIAGGSFSNRDFLVWPVVRSMTILDKHDDVNAWTSACADCGARVEMFANEYANGGWIEYLVIRPAPDATDVGAEVGPSPLRCRPLWAPGPRMGGQSETEKAFPMVSEADWLAWMRALRIEPQMYPNMQPRCRRRVEPPALVNLGRTRSAWSRSTVNVVRR